MLSLTTKCPQCPQCLGYTVRIHRRLSDRVLSLVKPVQRYQCQKYFCGWEGNVRVNGTVGAKINTHTKVEPKFN